MPHFICPSCGDRSISSERTAGFRNQARGCAKCGYGFLFELLDDYYPSPNAAFVVCDQEAKVISCGRGVRELVYQARPTPKVPKVTPRALDDAINTIQKRTNTLGVSEPEIQRAGANEIDIGLPGVQSTRAEQEVGTTAQLQFYAWEPNVYVNLNGKFQTLFSLEQSNPQIMRQANAIALPRLPLLQAVTLAAKLKPRADAND